MSQQTPVGTTALEPSTPRESAERYDVLLVENYEDTQGTERASWTRVGVAFAHKDGNGMNVELRAIPVGGKLVIRRHESQAKG